MRVPRAEIDREKIYDSCSTRIGHHLPELHRISVGPKTGSVQGTEADPGISDGGGGSV